MDPRFSIDVGHLILHLSTYLLPSCPNCVCACAEAAVTQVVPDSVDRALKFCHGIAATCSQPPAQQSSWSLSLLFWIGFISGIGFCVLTFLGYSFVKRLLTKNANTTTNTGAALPPIPLAAPVNTVVEPANPRVLRELGILRN